MTKLLATTGIFATLATAAPAAAGSYVVCDNGLNCVTAPCPSTNALDVQSAKLMRGIWVDLTGLSQRDQRRIESSQSLYYGTLVIAGRLEDRVINSTVGPRRLPFLVASRIDRESTEDEMKLCRANNSKPSILRRRAFDSGGQP